MHNIFKVKYRDYDYNYEKNLLKSLAIKIISAEVNTLKLQQTRNSWLRANRKYSTYYFP